MTSPLEALCRPAPLCALLVLVANDHIFKSAALLPAAVTGKLSDFAGLFLFPVLLSVVIRAATQFLGGSGRPGPVIPGLSALATACGFAALKLWPAFNRTLTDVWGVNVMDPSDLLALPAVALAYCWLRRNDARRGAATASGRALRRWQRTLVTALAALACVATSAPRAPRQFPMWEVAATPQETDCARITPVVSKSGKRGVGLTLAVRGLRAGSCQVQVRAAHLHLTSAEIPPVAFQPSAQAPAEVQVLGGQLQYIYLPFLFDNNRQWNRKVRQGHFAIDLNVAGRALPTWQLPANHVLRGYHRDLWRHTEPSVPAEPSYIAK